MRLMRPCWSRSQRRRWRPFGWFRAPPTHVTDDDGDESLDTAAAMETKEGDDGGWTFWVVYAYQDYEALKANLFSNVEEGTLGKGSIYTRFETAAQAKKWAGVEWKESRRNDQKWLAEPRHCFQRTQIPVEGRLTHDLLWKCTLRIVDRNGKGWTPKAYAKHVARARR